MSTDLVRIVLSRKGDDWTVAGFEVSEDGRAFAGLELAPFTAGSSPGGLLEGIGQALDAREADRLDRRLELTPTPASFTPIPDAIVEQRPARTGEPDEEDKARILEVLEDLGGRPASTRTLATLAGFDKPAHPMGSDGRLRALRALRVLELESVVAGIRHPSPQRAGDFLWSLREEALEIRRVANDDARGEGDR
jgi:hypothetical protein